MLVTLKGQRVKLPRAYTKCLQTLPDTKCNWKRDSSVITEVYIPGIFWSRLGVAQVEDRPMCHAEETWLSQTHPSNPYQNKQKYIKQSRKKNKTTTKKKQYKTESNILNIHQWWLTYLSMQIFSTWGTKTWSILIIVCNGSFCFQDWTYRMKENRN